MVGTFMLLFNLTVSGPSGAAGDEIINVYSKRFDTQIKCEQFLDDYDWQDSCTCSHIVCQNLWQMLQPIR